MEVIMSIGQKGLNNDYLDEDLCFCARIVSDSIGRAAKRMAADGIFNPYSGAVPSRMGVWFAATRSILFKEYMKKRECGERNSAAPTQEEFDLYYEKYKELLEKYKKQHGIQ